MPLRVRAFHAGVRCICLASGLSIATAASFQPLQCFAQTAAADTEDSVAVLLQRGLDLASQGKLAEAEVPLEQARTRAPRNTEVLTTLAKLKARLGETPAAIDLFTQVTAILPQSADAHLDLAITLADAEKLAEALQEVNRAVALAPGSALAHLNRARVLLDLHRHGEAEGEFATAARLAPANPGCFFYWALLEREQGAFAAESTHLKTLVKLQPGNDQAWLLLGTSFAYQSKQAEAIACWRKALVINPDSSQALYKLSHALRATDPGEAHRLDARFAAVQRNSQALDRVKTLGNQAYMAMQAQDWTHAIATFKQAIDLCGDCTVAAGLHKDLGLALCNQGNLAQGRVELQTALRLDPKDADTVRALAVLDHH